MDDSRQAIRTYTAPLAVLFIASCVSYWVFVIPYAAGHGDGRERIITWLMRHWSTATWLHGAFIPFAAIAMGWTLRKSLSSAKIAPASSGLIALLFGFLLLWAGYRNHVVYFGLAGTHILIAGFVLWFFGKEHFRILLYPFLFLALTWPFPFLEASLSFHLRLWMTEMSAGVLNLFGGDVSRQGTALVWPNSSGQIHMEIEGACSGLRSLFSLLAAAALLAFFVLRRPADRAVLVVASIPFAIVGNIIRIIILFLGVNLWGWEFAVGSMGSPSTFHLFAGILVIAIGLGGILLLASFLRRRGQGSTRTRMKSMPAEAEDHSGLEGGTL